MDWRIADFIIIGTLIFQAGGFITLFFSHIKGIHADVDRLVKRLDELPCVKHGEEIARIKGKMNG